MSRSSGDSTSNVLWSSVLAGLGGASGLVVLLAGAYFFEPAAKAAIEEHPFYAAIIVLFVFIAAFGMTLYSAMEYQWLSGKWK